MLDVSKIIQDNLSENCYHDEIFTKSQIVIHHTAGAPNAHNVISGWKAKADKVCTAFVISGAPSRTNDNFKDGDIIQAFSSKAWGFHLGVTNKDFADLKLPYKELNKTSVAIEICNFGYLEKTDKGYKNYLGGIIPEAEVCVLPKPYRGYTYYHAYTTAQLQSLRDLLIYLCDKYNIPKDYRSNMFDTNVDAMKGTPGIWTHTSYRANGKWDCSPQPALIQLLENLKLNSI